MNVHDSEKLAGALESRGYDRADGPDDADVVLLNTCSIREKAAEKVFDELGRLRRLKQNGRRVVLGVCGCVAQQEGEALLRRAPWVDLIVGPRSIATLPDAVERLRSAQPAVSRATFVDTEYRADSILHPYDEIRRDTTSGKAFVTVIEGCNHRCTYCIVPRTRGREICRDADAVADEVRRLAVAGVVEIELLGQTVNAYRDVRGRTLADLLREAGRVDGIRRLRFTTSHPAQMTPDLVDAMAETPQVCPYLHLPVQSGSTDVLRRMRRGYDREAYLGTIDALRRRMPGLAFGTDVIVGFPGETDADFHDTLSLLDAVEYDTVYSFTYSERPGTKAVELGDPLPLGLKLERLRELQARQKAIQERRSQRWIGREVEVLVDGPSKRDPAVWTGRSPENRIVHFCGDTRPGRLERVRVRAATAFSLRADPPRSA